MAAPCLGFPFRGTSRVLPRFLAVLSFCAQAAAAAGLHLLDPASTGLHWTNSLAPSRSLTNQMLLNGSGVASGDVDGDGRPDLFLAGLESPGTLFLNLGAWRFRASGAAGLADAPRLQTGVSLADLDGDGDLDLLVGAFFSGVHAYLNDGRGRFTRAPDNAGIQPSEAPMSLALADVDGDGDLDLFVAEYRAVALMDQPGLRFSYRMRDGGPELVAVQGRPVSDPDLVGRFSTVVRPDGRVERVENGRPASFYLNDGHGHFRKATVADGIFLDARGVPTAPPMDWGLSAVFHDLDGDGRPDLYVANDFESPDRLWWNDGAGRFRAADSRAMGHTSHFSMAVDVADVDRDGRPDLFVADMLARSRTNRLVQLAGFEPQPAAPGVTASRKQNTLQWNRGDRSFSEIAHAMGIEASDWTWGAAFVDLDLDGFEDLLLTSGNARDSMDLDTSERIDREIAEGSLAEGSRLLLRTRFAPWRTGRSAWRNIAGERFEEVSGSWGFDQPGIGQGIALADLDDDGDLDVVVQQLGATPALYRNDSEAPRIRVRLEGRAPNTRGIGATVRVQGGPVEQTEEVVLGGRYLSSDDTARTFAAGPTNRVSVRWRSGRESVVPDVPPGSRITVREPEGPVAADVTRTAALPLFGEESRFPAVDHVDDEHDEVSRQPGLTRLLSATGPGTAWWDLDGDGSEELLLGGGTGSPVRGWSRSTDARWIERTLAGWPAGDLGGWAPGVGPDGRAVLAGTLSGYENDAVDPGRIWIAGTDSSAPSSPFPPQPATTGPPLSVDLDGDGSPELVIAGASTPGRHPESAPTRVWRHRDGGWFPDPGLTDGLASLAGVQGLAAADLDGDGRQELVAATLWGPVRIYGAEAGRLVEQTARWGLDGRTGWWTCVVPVDADGDGRMDLVAGNWGWNSPHRPTPAAPETLWFGDADTNGLVTLVESRREGGNEFPWRERDRLATQFGWLPERFPVRADYAQATVRELLGPRLSRMRAVTANTVTSTLFLNRGGRFEAVPLPREAQWSPVNTIAVADADGDGHEDLFLGQNRHDLAPDEAVQDAGVGLWLLGDGRGGWKALTPSESGFHVVGDIRSASVGDFDGDARVDLAAGVHRGRLRLMRNLRASPGWRIRLEGPTGNPRAFGARLRIVADGHAGPVREVSGGGSLSVHSATLVLSAPPSWTHPAVEVRWPNGTTRRIALPPRGSEVTLRPVP